MKGGDDYYVTDPIVPVSSEVRTLSQTSGFMISNDSLTTLISNSFCYIQVEGNLLCLGIQKSDNLNIIGREYTTEEKFLHLKYMIIKFFI